HTLSGRRSGNSYRLGDAVRVQNASSDVDVRNNILWVESGYAFSVAADSQNGFESDYNLIHITGTSRLGDWGGVEFDNRADWFYELALGEHSLIADPLLVDPDGPDDVLGYDATGGSDYGLDDDFHLLAGSMAIDLGDQTFEFSNEPLPNGGRINVGAYGNTSEAALSPAALVQVLSPNGLEKYESDEQVPIRWHQSPAYTSVDVELLDAQTLASVLLIADDLQAPGEFLWTIPDTLTPNQKYRIRITAADGSAVSDVSDEAFEIANDGTLYYVNIAGDADWTDNEYTSAAGDNANNGKTPGAPMSSLSALMAAYDLDQGDTILVDTGEYLLVVNVLLGAQDSGVTIVGAQQPGHETILNRNNTSAGNYVFELLDADDVTLQSLSLTGGYRGLFADTNSDSDGLTILDSRIYDNAEQEIFLRTSNDAVTITDSEVFDSTAPGYHEYGIELQGDQTTLTGNVVYGHTHGIHVTGRGNQILDNTIYDNSDRGINFNVSADTGSEISDNTIYGNQVGIWASANGAAPWLIIENNEVFYNSKHGIEVTYNVEAILNRVYGNVEDGIRATRDAVIAQNTVWDNRHGIVLGGYYNSGVARNNRVYHNQQIGILAYYDSLVDGNTVYSNSIGVRGAPNVGSFIGHIVNNLLYDNENQGVLIEQGGFGADVTNNTIFQEVGDAVRVQGSSSDVLLRNNILWVNAAYDIFVASDSLSGFSSDYNLLHQGSGPNARVGYWGGTEADLLADWQATTGQDANSIEGDPLFVDPDGADNVRGFDPTNGGFDGGGDDNFKLQAASGAIDRAESWLATHRDLEG
ncbi:hypothetical protein LCGC14_1907880, partial [marine sediment metagenome]